MSSTVRLKSVPTPLRLGEILSCVGRIWTSSLQASGISILLKHPSWTLEQVVDLVRPFAITAGSSGCFQRQVASGACEALGKPSNVGNSASLFFSESR